MTRLPRAARAMLLLAVLGAGGCHHSPAPSPAPSQTSAPAPAAAPASAATLSAGRLVLPTVPGHPAAAYFTLRAGQQPLAITRVAVAGATSAEMHETSGGAMGPLPRLELAPGASVGFAPGGKHVMVFGLPASLKPGDQVILTLTGSDGATITGALTAEAPGGMGDMGGMKM